jgi:hypothetical protein
MLDFEVGAISAFRFSFPFALIMGCWFHFGQCLWRNFNLKAEYSSDTCLKRFFKQCEALALMPINKVDDVFIMIMDEAPIDKYPSIRDFLDYLTTNWIEQGISKTIWNHWDNIGERTNNNNEAYNLRINKKCGNAPHPNIWHFTELIQHEELLMTIKYEKIENGSIKQRTRKKKDVENLF